MILNKFLIQNSEKGGVRQTNQNGEKGESGNQA